ncbi:hypothetical protein DFS34DRAFT_685990 [Phlyctochytrium arcticum]|nr:hypothetical protein DFS34DRAFT_685990 [Phlyctochytrium arcticum]
MSRGDQHIASHNKQQFGIGLSGWLLYSTSFLVGFCSLISRICCTRARCMLPSNHRFAYRQAPYQPTSASLGHLHHSQASSDVRSTYPHHLNLQVPPSPYNPNPYNGQYSPYGPITTYNLQYSGNGSFSAPISAVHSSALNYFDIPISLPSSPAVSNYTVPLTTPSPCSSPPPQALHTTSAVSSYDAYRQNNVQRTTYQRRRIGSSDVKSETIPSYGGSLLGASAPSTPTAASQAASLVEPKDDGDFTFVMSTMADVAEQIHREEYAPKKRRTKTSDWQRDILVQVFETETTMPDPERRKQLSAMVNMTPRAVQVWFQNRRAKVRTQATRVGSGLLTLRSSHGTGIPPGMPYQHYAVVNPRSRGF